jgi:hypothetical protein
MLLTIAGGILLAVAILWIASRVPEWWTEWREQRQEIRYWRRAQRQERSRIDRHCGELP